MEFGSYLEIRSILYVIFIIYVTLIALKIILENKPPEVLIAWLVVLVLLPYVGGFVYLFVGVDWRKQKILKYRPEEIFRHYFSRELRSQSHEIQAIPKGSPLEARLIPLLAETGGALLTRKNRMRFHFEGQVHFDELLMDLAGARQSIHMEYFIWRSDELGSQIQDLLIQRARQGVEVRLIFDGMGSFGQISYKSRREMKKAGIEFRYFLDPRSYFNRLMINYRNHRKIVVIDGRIGYTGGMNVGKEYITGGRRFPAWRDTHVRVEGETVAFLQGAFLTDWANSRGEILDGDEYFPGLSEDLLSAADLPCQVICSGPDSTWHTIKNELFSLITGAEKEILIQSPYLIPDQSLMAALTNAALSGIDVKLMITGWADKRIPYWVAETYFDPLTEAGVQIFRYQKGFFHPKMIVVDRRVSSVGTCNMDVRSFHLNYEINMVIYDAGASEELVTAFFRDLESCRRVFGRKTRLSMPIRFRNSLFRILAPLL